MQNSNGFWLPITQYRFLTYDDACDILGEVNSMNPNGNKVRISPECQML